MCIVSMIGDGWQDQFPGRWPNITPGITQPKDVTRAEFEALKREIQELKVLLNAAKKFDEATGQPNCEIDDKVRLIKEIAKMVGVDMSDVFDAKHSNPRI
jgi:hypothetical protein